jgi:hypothetical protein
MTRARLVPVIALTGALTGCSDGPQSPGFEPAMQQSAGAPVIVSFQKDFTGLDGPTMIWQGQVILPDNTTADLTSTLDTSEPGTREAGATLHATVRWVITGHVGMEIETRGVINLNTGLVRTNGRVVSGEWAGAQVHQEGQLDGLDASGHFRINAAATR